MNTSTYSEKFLQQRKFYTVLPLLALPFFTMLYYVLWVKRIQKNPVDQTAATGLLTTLPDAVFKDDKELNKLGFYQIAAADSARIREQIKKDPYRNQQLLATASSDSMVLQGLDGPFGKKRKVKPVSYQGKTYSDPGEVAVYSKLKELDQVLATATQPEFNQVAEVAKTSNKVQMPDLRTRLADLDQIATPSLDEIGSPDPELSQLEGMLDKILEIQQPDRYAENQPSSKNTSRQAFAVQSVSNNFSITCLGENLKKDSTIKIKGNGFFSLEEPQVSAIQEGIRAEIDQDLSVTSGSTIRLRLLNDIQVAGSLIKKYSFIYGIASINSERLHVLISTIAKGSVILPVDLKVYDLDGIPGIYVPGAISRDVAKQSLSQDIQGLNLGSLDPSLGAQAASAGIQAAKTLFGKKARMLKVHVSSGYQVILSSGNSTSRGSNPTSISQMSEL